MGVHGCVYKSGQTGCIRHGNENSTTNQITAPLIPKVKGPADTRHFPEYEENKNLFKCGRDVVHAKEFEDF